MASKCRIAEKHVYWKEFESNRHQFFKVMIGDFRNHLRIPKKFVANFRENLLGTVHLRGPSGSMWSVEAVRMFDQVVFLDGWQAFVEDHRLDEADMLVFRYSDNSSFNVLVFDPTGCEREGSYFVREHTDACSNAGCVLELEDDEDSEEIIELEKLHLQKRKISKGRERPGFKAVDAAEKKKPPARKSAVETVLVIDKSGRVRGCAMEGNGEHQSKMKRPAVEKISMQNKKIRNGTGGLGSKVVGNYNRHHSNATEKNRKSSFEWEVSIDESDGHSVSALEANEEQSKMKRPIDFPGSYYMHFISNRLKITEEEKQRPRKLSMRHSPKRPSFTVLMKASHVNKNFLVRIPKKWDESHIVGDVKRAVLKVHPGKKTWDVGIRSKPWGKSFTRGWAKFVWDNNLETHDACVFELNDKGKANANGAIMVFDVFIYRVLDETVPLTKFSKSGGLLSR